MPMHTYSRFFFLGVILILTMFMLINPRETIEAASTGIHLWYSLLVPALLPFFIAADLLVSTGLVAFLGILLEPIMRPLFHLPGCSSMVVAMGFTSGFPVGAILTRRLYDEKLLTVSEAEHLVSFTNNSSPLFIVGAVGLGMLSSPLLGYILALSHYLANLIVGILLGLRTTTPAASPSTGQEILTSAWRCLKEHKSAGPGQLMGEAIKNSLNNILAIGGFVIVFSILIRLLDTSGAMQTAAGFCAWILAPLGLDYQMAYALCTGFFEITLGSRAAAAGVNSSILGVMLVISVILAFSGCSIIAQVMSIVAGIPVRLSYYLGARCLQILLSLSLTTVVYRILAPAKAAYVFSPSFLYSFNAWRLSLIFLLSGLFLVSILALCTAVSYFNNRPS